MSDELMERIAPPRPDHDRPRICRTTGGSPGTLAPEEPGSQRDGNFVHPTRLAVITPEDEQRSLAAMVFTAPGVPMLFQGQEFLKGEWFRDTVPVDWDQNEEFRGIVRLYHDLIRLRLNRDGFTLGLCGQFTQVYHLHDQRKVIAFHRWDKGGPADDVVVAC